MVYPTFCLFFWASTFLPLGVRLLCFVLSRAIYLLVNVAEVSGDGKPNAFQDGRTRAVGPTLRQRRRSGV